MKNRYIASFESAQTESKEIPQFRAGDTVRLGIEIKEGEKKRVQTYEGIVIARHGEGVSATFNVRKIGANSVGVERIFPLFSDSIKTFEVCGADSEGFRTTVFPAPIAPTRGIIANWKG